MKLSLQQSAHKIYRHKKLQILYFNPWKSPSQSEGRQKLLAKMTIDRLESGDICRGLR